MVMFVKYVNNLGRERVLNVNFVHNIVLTDVVKLFTVGNNGRIKWDIIKEMTICERNTVVTYTKKEEIWNVLSDFLVRNSKNFGGQVAVFGNTKVATDVQLSKINAFSSKVVTEKLVKNRQK